MHVWMLQTHPEVEGDVQADAALIACIEACRYCEELCRNALCRAPVTMQ